MSSGGDKKETTVQTNDPPEWAVPYYKQGLDMASDFANQQYTPYTGQRVAGFNTDQQRAFQMTRHQAGLGRTAANQGLDYIQDTLRGGAGANKYAGSNPYLGRMIGDAQGDVVRAYRETEIPSMMAQFNAGGAFGGTAQQQAMAASQRELAQELGDISTTMRGQDYDRQAALAESQLDRNLAARQSALGMLPEIQQAGYLDAGQLGRAGQLQQMLGQQQLDARYDQFMDKQNWDQNRLGALASMLGTIQGGTSSMTGANPNYRSAGQNAAAAAAIIASMWG